MSPSKKLTKKAAPKKKASAKTTAKKAAAPKKAAAKSASKSPKKKAAAPKKSRGSAAKASGKETAKKVAPKKAAPKKAAAQASDKVAAKSADKTKTAAKTAAKKPSAPAKQAGSKKGTKAKGSGGKSPAKNKKGRAKKPILPTGPRHPKLGFRWICFNCDAKFYDLGKEEPICPKCEANQQERPSKEAKSSSDNTPKPKVVRPMAQLLDEEDPAPAANADDDRRAPRKPTGDGEMFDAAETDDASLDIEEPEVDSAAEPPDIDI